MVKFVIRYMGATPAISRRPRAVASVFERALDSGAGLACGRSDRNFVGPAEHTVRQNSILASAPSGANDPWHCTLTGRVARGRLSRAQELLWGRVYPGQQCGPA